MIYKFRITLDVLDDVFRDIAIRDTDTFEDLQVAEELLKLRFPEGNDRNAFWNL